MVSDTGTYNPQIPSIHSTLHLFLKNLMLSNKSTQEIASALVDDVIKYIEEDSRYVDFMQEVIPDAIQSYLGSVDEDLKFDLSLCIMDRICFRKSNF